MEIRDAIREERACSVILLNYRKNGDPFWNAFSLVPVKSCRGIVEYFVGIQADVTSLMTTEEVKPMSNEVLLVAEEEKLQAMTVAQAIGNHGGDLLKQSYASTCASDDSVPSSLINGLSAIAGSFVLSDPNLPDNPMVYCSPDFLSLTGYSQKELIGRNCRLLQGPRTDKASVNKIREALHARRSVTVTLINYKKDGSLFQNCVHIAPIRDAAGKVQFFCGVQLDVTEVCSTDEIGIQISESQSEGILCSADRGAEKQGLRQEVPGELILNQKGVIGAVRVAARALSMAGLRRNI
jgi:PAS domain S-box-containing protein